MGTPVKSNKFCTQYFDVIEMMENGCSYSACRHCGFNSNVAKYRKQIIEKYGLKKDEDGLYRLHIPKRRRGNATKT